MYYIVIAVKSENAARCIDNILFSISSVDETFKYSKRKYDDKISFKITAENKDIAYSRGLVLRSYIKAKCLEDVYFKVVAGGGE